MKLTSLQALGAAIEEGSLRKAADRLGVSQPALSKLVRELELELSTTLLTRTSKGVLATPQGKVLHGHSQAVERELKAARSAIAQIGGSMVGDIRIAAVPLAVLLLIPETLRTFSKAYPDIRLSVTEELYMTQLQKLRNKEVDIALCGIPDSLAPGEFEMEPLVTTRMVVVMRKGHPLAKSTSLQELADAKWVYTHTAPETGYAKTLFETHGLKAPPVGAIVNSTLTLLSLIATGEYVGLLPHQIAILPLAKQYVDTAPIKDQVLDITVGVIVRTDSMVLPPIRNLLTHLHRAANQLKQ
ncbi:MAG: LysR family transcriptional regulator [Curvibacter sp.]|nr:MAG: LysR family transcriptional regulator [Curvibacter sp.]